MYDVPVTMSTLSQAIISPCSVCKTVMYGHLLSHIYTQTRKQLGIHASAPVYVAYVCLLNGLLKSIVTLPEAKQFN